MITLAKLNTTGSAPGPALVAGNAVRSGNTGTKQGVQIMRQLFGVLLAVWTLAAFPVAFFFLMNLNWDHRFGHAPVANWVFTGAFALIGLALFKGAWRHPAQQEKVQA